MLKEGLARWVGGDRFGGDEIGLPRVGASPNIELSRRVLGVDSAGPGFGKIRVAPHPMGLIEVRVERGGPDGLIVEVEIQKR